VAWCIVPFDTAKRDAAARAAMLERLQIRRLAYDWRAEHVPQFDAEVIEMQRRGIEILAWWFPNRIDDASRRIVEVISRHGIRPQLWTMGSAAPLKDPAGQEARVAEEAAKLRPVLEIAAKLGCQVGLYNHGGWFGEPENQLAILARLRAEGFTKVGLVYNFHHGHEHLDRFPELWRRIKDHTLAVNLNGMIAGGDKAGKKILYLGEGDRELAMLRFIQESGWRGPIGVLNHRMDTDAEVALRANLAGLDQLAAKLRAVR
jgi:sugar phosphate isomerase/epimerase